MKLEIMVNKNSLRVGVTRDKSRLFVLPGWCRITDNKRDLVYQLSRKHYMPMITAGFVVLRINYIEQTVRLACVGKPIMGKEIAEIPIAKVYRSNSGNPLIMDLRDNLPNSVVLPETAVQDQSLTD